MEIEKYRKVEEELRELINRNSLENEGDIPDFILAEYLAHCIIEVSVLNKKRDKWFGFKPFSELTREVGK